MPLKKGGSLKISVLGSGQQVGKAGILVSHKDRALLLDYGVDISAEEPDFPLNVYPKILSGVVLTHAHLDHSGALPMLYISAEPTTYSTALSMDLAEILINDFLKISKYYAPYETIELSAMKRNARFVDYGEEVVLDDVSLKLWSAGHIQGSSMVELEVGGYRVLYTSDFNLETSCLLKKAPIEPFRRADILIMESTYASFNHPDRRENEKNFVDAVEEVLDGGGRVLIPAFAVGRAQEIMCVLAKYDIGYPIYLDGMARIVSQLTLSYRNFLRSPSLFKKAYSIVRKIDGWKARRRAVKEPAVIISPAGMLKGGASVFYMEKIMDDPKSAVFLVSYQVEDSPGRNMLKEGVFVSEKRAGTVKARIEWYDFSAHCGRRELERAVKATKRSATIVLVHGEREVEEKFASFIEEDIGRQVYYPPNGEVLEF